MKKLLSLLLTALLLLGTLAGCGAKSDMAADNGYYSEVEKPEAGYDGLYGQASDASSQSSVTTEDQKLIKTVTMRAETEGFDDLLANLDEKISQLGGYVESRDVYNGSAYSTYRSRSAELCVRIPADKLDAFVEQVSGMSNIISTTEQVENVTLTYVSIESRVKALQTEEARLLEFMEKSETMSDLLEVEARLTEVRSQLESVTSQLRVLENQVSYATVNLDIDEVRQLTVVQEQNVWQRIGSGFMDNLKDLGESIVELFVRFVTNLPYLVPAALLVLVVILLIKRRVKRKKKNTPPTPEQPQE